MPIKPGGMLLLGIAATIPTSVEPFLFGGVMVLSVEPFDFGSLVNAAASSVEPFNFGMNARAASAEPFDFGSNAAAKSVEPFDLGSSGGARAAGGTIVADLGTVRPAPAAPLMGWRDR